ncbi:MAG: hypothetical protein AAF235_12350, partial [Planctomycetota bacterium]
LVDAGAVIVLSAGVDASGVDLAWNRDGVPLQNGGRVSGANDATLMIMGATPADAGLYDLVVTAGPIEARSATVVVGVKPGAADLDFDGDGVVDAFDLLELVAAIEAAGS